ncbi:MAG: hypothetical protein Tp118SUR00d2C21406231_50 [Prokaryotic dsDNA virus sp.]|nr:MAG: hypothetical protein Tp125DCM00d2C40298531_69 [Prokaryotic dsDNA virus sp.]QDP53170.1 MAG: hypothetical protein Tp118SUR00d2C21406231_50 [Prokaryotic dsDNA virus sp.]
MTWGLVEFVKSRVLSAFNRPACAKTGLLTGLRGDATNTAPKSSACGENTLTRIELIERRALRKRGNNRAATVTAFLTVHQTLNRGACSNGK